METGTEIQFARTHVSGNDFVEIENVITAPANSYGMWRAWYALVVLVIQLLASGIDLAIVTLLVHPIETALHINDVVFAAITATPIAIGFTVASYLGGLLADTFRRRDVLVAGSVLWALGALVASRADSVTMLFCARLLAGIGTAVTYPAMFSMLSDAFPRTHRAVAVGVTWSGNAIGIGIGLAVCSALVAATQRNGMVHIGGIVLSPWQQCFVAVATIGLIIIALILTVREPQRRDRSTHTKTNLISSLSIFGHYLQRHRLLWALLFLGGAINAVSYFGTYSWGPAFGARHYGATGVSSIALLGTFVAAGSLFGCIVGGILAQRGINHGDPRLVPRMFVINAVLSGLFAVGFPFMPTWLFAALGIGAANATANAQSVLMASGIQETASNEVRGQLFGFWAFMAYTPSIGAATLVAFLASGVFAKVGGLGPALAVTGGTMSALAALLFAFSGAPYERARHESHSNSLRQKTCVGGEPIGESL